MSIKTKTQDAEFEIITITCPACKAHRTVLDNGWSAIICFECREEISHPAKVKFLIKEFLKKAISDYTRDYNAVYEEKEACVNCGIPVNYQDPKADEKFKFKGQNHCSSECMEHRKHCNSMEEGARAIMDLMR